MLRCPACVIEYKDGVCPKCGDIQPITIDLVQAITDITLLKTELGL